MFIQVTKVISRKKYTSVELIKLNNKKYILKTAPAESIAKEKFFIDTLIKNNLPYLKYYSYPQIKQNQLLLEYFPENLLLKNKFTLESCIKWASAIRKIHKVNFDSFFYINDYGNYENMQWREFLEDYLAYLINKLYLSSDSLGIQFKKTERILNRVLDFKPKFFSLIHGDLHVENAAFKKNEIVLFDSVSTMAVGPRIYDLSIVYSETLSVFNKNLVDTNLYLHAFNEAYGDLSEEEKYYLDYFILLRSLHRYPNRHSSFLDKTIRQIIRKIG